MKFYVWKSQINGNWYWHAKRKGRIVSDSSEGYKHKAHAVKMACAMATAARPVFIDSGLKDTLGRPMVTRVLCR